MNGSHIKKLFCGVWAALLIVTLAACAGTEPEETTAAPVETETFQPPTLEEMSPPSMSTAMPIEIPKTYAEVDKSAFKSIKKEDSRWPESEAGSVYRCGDTEYYIMQGGVVFAVIADERNDAYYSACYDQNGVLSFFGDEKKDWYFTDGAFDYMMYTYTAPGGAQVRTFYEGEDSRFAVYAGNTYYDGELNELTGPQQVELVTRVAAAFSMMGGADKLG